MSLPKEINYTNNRINLPAGTTSQSIVVTPANGSVFNQNQTVIFNLPSRSYAVPSSIYFRYKMTNVGGDASSNIRGSAPVYTPFVRLDTLIGSNNYESISAYNVLNNMLVSLKMNYAQKLGLAPALGLLDNAGAVAPTFSNLNCHDVAGANEVITVGAPLNCLLANADSLIPLKYMPAVSIQLTTDTVANIFTNVGGGAIPTDISISNLELCMDLIDFNDDVDRAVMSMADERGKILIKSQSYMTSAQNAPASSQGTLEFIYSMRLASIKSLFLSLQGTHATSVNKLYDSLDITSNNGQYQFFVASTPYPSRPISTVLNKNGAVLMELSGALGPAHDLLTSNFAITPAEFNYTNTATTTVNQLGRFFVGTNVERLSSNNVLLSGISSQLSPISVRIDINTATTNAQVLNLIVNYDAVFEIDVMNKQCSILQ
jgi:hypothetical protein